MYVCICNPVSDTEVRRCVRSGACTLSDLKMQLGIASQCGMCASAAVSIIAEETGQAASPAQCPSGFPAAA
jgi:bacterioferritin-associated ferredoxin